MPKNDGDFGTAIYNELRRLAAGAMRRERPGQTLQATALVHEAYLRLAGANATWTDRNHFLGIAARSMRQILVDRARARSAQKRWAGMDRVTLTESLAAARGAGRSRIDAPGICTVYALEEIEGDLFVATEFIEGRTLRQEMASGERSTGPELLQTAREIADALAHAHGTGMTHGDLKPENVMRMSNGRLKILDFGLARFEGRASPEQRRLSDTQPGMGMIAGTPGYMAPEQLDGGARDIRGDVFAFGVLMYEYACGTHPFDASTPLGMAARVLEGHARPLEQIRPDLPPVLGTVIERCLRKVAADRFPSAVQIVECLAREDRVVPRARVATWWRAHQFIIIGLYASASIAAWLVRELHGGATTAVFLAIGITATVAAVFRGHLLFTERMNGSRLTAERRRTAPVTMGVDLLISLALAVDGAIIASTTPLPAVLIVSLSACLALAGLILEPSTTAAAFDDR